MHDQTDIDKTGMTATNAQKAAMKKKVNNWIIIAMMLGVVNN